MKSKSSAGTKVAEARKAVKNDSQPVARSTGNPFLLIRMSPEAIKAARKLAADLGFQSQSRNRGKGRGGAPALVRAVLERLGSDAVLRVALLDSLGRIETKV